MGIYGKLAGLAGTALRGGRSIATRTSRLGKRAMVRARKFYRRNIKGKFDSSFSIGFGMDLGGKFTDNFGAVGAALKEGSQSGGNADLPSLDTPDTVNKIKDPSLTDIDQQLKSILKVVRSMGLLTKKQQELLVAEIQQAKRTFKENTLEAKDASQMSTDEFQGMEIQPANDALVSLTEAFTELTDVVEQLISGQGGSGITDLPHQNNDAVGPNGPQRPSRYGKYIKGAITALKVGGVLTAGTLAAAAPYALASAQKAVNNTESKDNTVPESTVSKEIGETISGDKIGSRKQTTQNDAITQMARDMLAKTINKNNLSATDILTPGVNPTVAAEHIVSGDISGAGINASSGMEGPLKAIPSLVAAISRDLYAKVYNTTPDKADSDPRLKGISDIVSTSATSLLSDVFRVPSKPSLTQPAPAPKSAKSAPTPTPTPAQTTNTGAPSSTSTPAENNNAGGKTRQDATSESKPVASAASSGTSSAAASPEINGMQISNPNTPGSDITKAQIAQTAAMQEPYMPNLDMAGRPRVPSFIPTNRPGFVGMGDVPDPNYPMSDFNISVLYY